MTHLPNQLVGIGEKIDDVELVNMTLNGIPMYFEPFFKGFCSREKIPYW
jgi:hypothetical protein